MREIKFRAYDFGKKYMIYSENVKNKDYHFWIQPICDDGFNDGLVHVKGIYKISENMSDVMQFTGLLDKNRKEIYEFDLLQFDWFYIGDSKEKGGIGIVKYEDDGFGLYRSNGDYVGTIWDMIKNHGAEIIGNIYENGDLLG